MKWLKLQVFTLVAAFLIANGQCLLACTAEPCHDEQASASSSEEALPPCHQQQQQQSPSDESTPCAPATFVADHRAPVTVAVQMHAVIAFSFEPVALQVLSERARPADSAPAALPDLIRSTILRV